MYSAYRATVFLTVLLMVRPYAFLNKHANQFEPDSASFFYMFFKPVYLSFSPDEESGETYDELFKRNKRISHE
jgi:hypothetical protein